MFRGKRFRRQTIRVICHAYNQIEKETKVGRMRGSAAVRTAKVTGVSRATVFRLLHESKGTGTAVSSSPSRRCVYPDDFGHEAIRVGIYNMSETKINITINRLLVSIEYFVRVCVCVYLPSLLLAYLCIFYAYYVVSLVAIKQKYLLRQ